MENLHQDVSPCSLADCKFSLIDHKFLLYKLFVCMKKVGACETNLRWIEKEAGQLNKIKQLLLGFSHFHS